MAVVGQNGAQLQAGHIHVPEGMQQRDANDGGAEAGQDAEGVTGAEPLPLAEQQR